MTSVVMIGVGGAGCYLANQIQSKISCNSLAIDRAPHLLNDYSFSNKIAITEQGYDGDVLDESYKAALLLDIKNHLKDSSVLVLTIGLGGYIGTTLGIDIATLARNQGIKIICVTYKPFAFEVARHQIAFNALEELQVLVDELVIHDHATGLSAVNQSQPLLDYFIAAGETMVNEVRGRLTAKFG